MGLEVGTDLDEQRIGPRILNAGAAVFSVEVLHMNVEAVVCEELAAHGPHAMWHIGAVKGLEEPRPATPAPGQHGADQSAPRPARRPGPPRPRGPTR